MITKDILIKVGSYLNNNKIPYVIVGGFSAIALGRVRTTYDIDIIVDQKKLDLSSFVSFLFEIGLLPDKDDINQAFSEKSHSSILFKDKPIFRIDLKGIYTNNDLETIKTAKLVKFEGVQIKIGSPENLIAHKLLFGSERDYEDALVVLVAQKEKMDLHYLKTICVRLGVEKKLENLLNEVME